MQYEVTIRFDSKQALLDYLGGGNVPQVAEAAAEARTANGPVEVEKPKRGRKPNAEKPATAAAEPPKEAEPAATKVHTLADLHKAGTVYLNKNGMGAMMKLMGKYGAQRTGEIKEEDRGKFIADCDNNVVVP